MKTTEKIIARNIFIAGYMSCQGGVTLPNAKKWFDKTYPKSKTTEDNTFQYKAIIAK
jgi:hypothetical protein